jgi:hypothetical protein
MSEKNFQKALIHLYVNIERYYSYSDDIFEPFGLSSSEKESLKELMTSQRERLLLFNRHLTSKRRRSILHNLPKSRDIIGPDLEALVDAYLSGSAPEGTCDPEEAVRSFADYVRSQIDGRVDSSRELEFVWFEAVCASVARPRASTRSQPLCALRLSSPLRLSTAGDAEVVCCTYDVSAAIDALRSLQTTEDPVAPCWFFLFQDSSGEVRILAISPGLARVLTMFRSGLSLPSVLQALERETEKTAALGAIEKLLLLGAPFFFPGGSDGRGYTV